MTQIDIRALSEKLGCPVFDTTSTTGDGLAEVVKAAVSLNGQGQKAPYHQGNIDLTDKTAVEAADRKRFAFVNKIVAKVETRKVLTKEKNAQDKIDAVLTHPKRNTWFHYFHPLSSFLLFSLYLPAL